MSNYWILIIRTDQTAGLLIAMRPRGTTARCELLEGKQEALDLSRYRRLGKSETHKRA